jgi:hypothetical protein
LKTRAVRSDIMRGICRFGGRSVFVATPYFAATDAFGAGAAGVSESVSQTFRPDARFLA